MPFKSEAQRRFLWMMHPKIAKRWAHEKGGQKKNLPMHKRKKKEMTALNRILLKALSTNAQLREVEDAFRAKFNNYNEPAIGSERYPYCWPKEVFLDDGYLIAESAGKFHKVNFSKEDGEYEFDDRDEWAEMEQVYKVKELDLTQFAFKHPGHGNQKVHGAWARVAGGLRRADAARQRFPA